MILRWRGVVMDSGLLALCASAWLLALATYRREPDRSLPAPAAVAAITVAVPPVADAAADTAAHAASPRNTFEPWTAAGGSARPSQQAGGEMGGVPPALLIRLLGTTVIGADRSFAVLSVAGATPATFRVGDTVRDWTIVGIERGLVRLERGGRTEELELARGT